jgi:hypothetical protein
VSNKRRKSDTSAKSRPKPRPQAQEQKSGLDAKKIAVYVGGAALLGVLIFFIISDQGESVDLPNNAEVPAGVEFYDVYLGPDADRTHTDQAVAYPQDPPVGGPHNPVWSDCGFYDEPIANETVIHALEHGVVWITYQPDLPSGEIDTLKAFGNESEVIVSPYPGLATPVSAQVWGGQMFFDTADDPELLDFVSSLRDATGPEPGASCLGGIGDPSS